MKIQFTTAESAFCSILKTRQGHEEHISRPHLPISSLPNPTEWLEISQYPIDVTSETADFDPKRIASLWLSLLVIQVQNGNFWNHDDVLRPYAEKAYQRTLDEWRAAKSKESEKDNSSVQKLGSKDCLYIRHKVQRALLSRDTPISEESVSEVSDLIRRLEEAPALEPDLILESSIHKIFKSIVDLETIPADEKLKIQERCKSLLSKWLTILDRYETKSDTSEQDSSLSPPSYEGELERLKEQLDVGTATDFDPTPRVCITQMTPEQCARVEALAAACDPPLDRAVVELMCMLPQFSAQNEHETYQIAAYGQILDPVMELENNSSPERRFDGFGPKIPPHVLQLTEFLEGHYGKALYVDTKTGEGIVFKEYRLSDPDEIEPTWEHLIGERIPPWKLLQEWREKFRDGLFTPTGGSELVHGDVPRYMSHWRMDALRHKFLLHEFGWPKSFPLAGPRYLDFLKAKDNLHNTTFHNHPRSLADEWRDLVWDRQSIDSARPDYDPSNTEQRELLHALNQSIRQALDHHVRRYQDLEYALAADVPRQQDLIAAPMMTPGGSGGDDWQVEWSPEMMMERFEEVYTETPKSKCHRLPEMREIVTKAYEKWKLHQQGIYEPNWVEGEDDDSSSDYEPDDDDEDTVDENEDEENYEDEDVGDLDISVLQADMAKNVEACMPWLEDEEEEKNENN